MLQQLDDEHLEEILNKDRKFIEDAWTTGGLWKNMQALFQHFTAVSAKVLNFANQIKNLVDATYVHFHEKYGFARLSPPALNLEKHTLTMTGMQETARQFCHDPVNMAKYKDFVVKRFYESLVGEARQIFELTRLDAETWLKLGVAIRSTCRSRSTRKCSPSASRTSRKSATTSRSVEDRIKELKKLEAALQAQAERADRHQEEPRRRRALPRSPPHGQPAAQVA